MSNTSDLNKSLAKFEDELSKLKTASDEIEKAKEIANDTISASIKSLAEVTENSKKLQQSSIELINTVEQLLSKIDRVDFPSRLDKLDASVVGINSAIQNIFTRFDSVERNLKDDIQSKAGVINEQLRNLKRNNLILLASISILSLSTLIIVFLKLVF
jgi:chromosome segregation ATPase